MDRLTLILMLPLLGFLINGLFGSRLPRRLVALVACLLPAASFALTLDSFAGLDAETPAVVERLFTWVALASLEIEVALYFDQITAVMCLVVTGVGTLIHIYSVGYMAQDKSFSRYFAYLNLFLFFMLLLVLGKNLPMLFAGWEGVGFASYLLIGFWFEDGKKTAASIKAFVVNRVGDTAFILAMFLIFHFAGSLDFQELNSFFSTGQLATTIMGLIAILLLVGACGKSAQIPLHVWLPDAMAGPTPVSALIHAATMVTAGVYLLVRMNGLFLNAPDAMTVVAWGGGLTALVGATMGVTQYNLKKVLAYSTMSQIGYMIMACGVGAFPVAMFHLYSHAFFKACLFLGAGAVIHALHGEEDMRNMGGLAKRIPFTFATFLFASLALCGVPPFAGFFSKDEILWSVYASAGGSTALWLVGTVASLLTSFYMFRAIFLTFFGPCRVPEKVRSSIHEAPPAMSIVLAVLACCSLLAGFIGLPGFWRQTLGVSAPFYDFLAPVFAHLPDVPADHHAEGLLMALSVVVAFAGIFLAWLFFHRRPDWAGKARQRAGYAHTLVSRGYFFDRLYQGIFVRGIDWLSESVLARRVETALSAGTIERPGEGAGYASRIFSRLQTGNVQGYVLYVLAGLALALWWGVTHA